MRHIPLINNLTFEYQIVERLLTVIYENVMQCDQLGDHSLKHER